MSYEKQLALIEANLQPGEQVIASVKGVDGSITGALVVTNQRFVFFGSNGLKRERRGYPLSQITSIEHENNKLGNDYLRVAVPSGREKYLVGRGDEVKQFVATALSTLAQAQNPATAAPPASADVTDQLAKLGQLRDAGVLTDEEFAAKKAELLARL